MKKFLVFPVAILIVLIAFGTSNAALLDGKQIYVKGENLNNSTPETDYGLKTVGVSYEILDTTSFYGNSMYIDISDTNIKWTFQGIGRSFPSGSFSGFHFQDTVGNIPGFGSVTINSSVTPTLEGGFDSSRISWDENNIYVNFQGLYWGYLTTYVSLDLTPVPIPSAVYLFGTGLVGLVGLKRRRRPKS